jgi:transcriptional regulator with XRE-family HTH domain
MKMATSAGPNDGMGDVPSYPFSNEEIGKLVRKLRGNLGWSQEQLTERARFRDVKTVQRVEAGRPTSGDTRRALARAFEIDDLEFFNRSRPHPSPEQLRAIQDKFERENVVLDAERIGNGRELILKITAENALGVVPELGDLPQVVQDLLMAIHDCLLELIDILEVAAQSELLGGYSDKFDDLISGLNAEGHCLYVAQRRSTYLAAIPNDRPIKKFAISLKQ